MSDIPVHSQKSEAGDIHKISAQCGSRLLEPNDYERMNLKNIVLGKAVFQLPHLSIEQTEADLQKTAKAAADLFMRNGDFGYGLRKTHLTEIFNDATVAGPESVNRLADAINQELMRRNSPLRLSAACSGGSVMPDRYAVGNFSLTNKDTGTVEDRMRVGPGLTLQ